MTGRQREMFIFLIFVGVIAALVIPYFLRWQKRKVPSVERPSTLEQKLDDPKNPLAATVKKLGDGIYQLGAVTIDARKSELRLDGKINMVEGLIEVLICTPYGKAHESVFVVDMRPMDLHTSCLLLGMTAGANPAWRIPTDPSFLWPGWDRPPGSMAQIFVAWDTPEGPKEIRVEETLIDQRTKTPIGRCDWVFVGSIVDPDGNYLADGVGSIVTNYHDPQSVFDCPLPIGQSDDFTFANTAALPAVGTAVRLRIVPVNSPIPAKEYAQ